MPTIKQLNLIKIVQEQLGTKGDKTLAQMMIEAGYSKAISKNPYLIFDSDVIQEGLKDFLSQLDDKRRRAITHLTDTKLKAAPARELAYVIDTLTKNHQLLTGNATQNVAVGLKHLKDDELERIAEGGESGTS